MNNEIGRKITSLTLMTIMIAGGMTFAIPGVMPAAHAQANANLFVSVESSVISDRFGGPMVIEVVINDPDLKEIDEAESEPNVEINGADLRMAQADDGNWYGYFADRIMATTADAVPVVAGTSIDFGFGCTSASASLVDGIDYSGTTGVFFSLTPGGAPASTLGVCAAGAGAPDVQNVIRENRTLNDNPGSTGGIGQLGYANWPTIQLFDFTAGGDATIAYNIGGGSAQEISIEFDDALDDHPTSGITVDRSTGQYPQSASLHMTINDIILNIDPTDEDSWTFGTNATANATAGTVYDLFNEDGGVPASLDPGATGIPTVAVTNLRPVIVSGALNHGDLAQLLIDGDSQSSGTFVLNARDNADTIIAFDAINAGDANDATTPGTGSSVLGGASLPVTFVETQSKTGTFVNTDEGDISNILITAGALRGTTATVDYNDAASSVRVTNFFGSIDMDASALGGEWNSGEEIPVSLTDFDLNLNSLTDEDIDLSNAAFALVPSLQIGNPITLEDTADGGAVGTGNPSVDVEIANVGGDFAVQAFSKRANIGIGPGGAATLDAASGANIVTFTYPDAMAPTVGFIGNGTTNALFSILNYDIRSLATTFSPAGTTASINITLTNGLGAHIGPSNATLTGTTTSGGAAVCGAAPGVCRGNGNNSPIAGLSTTSYQGLVDLQNADLSVFGVGGFLNVIFNFTGTGAGANPLAAGNFTAVVDIFNYGQEGDGVTAADRSNNAIYRLELEESADNSGIFVGSVEYIMLNQININQSNTYIGSIDPISDAIEIVIHEDLTDEDAPRINFLDLGADGVFTQIADQQEAPTHSGVISFDSSTYKVADTVTVSLEDADLNVDVETIDVFTVVAFNAVDGTPDAAFDQVGTDNYGQNTAGENFGRLLDVTFDDELWTSGITANGGACGAAPAGAGTPDDGLGATGFTLGETGPDTGVFTGDFQVPGTYCQGATGLLLSVTGTDIEVNYVDFRDASGEIIEVGDGAGIRANTGSVSLDRTVYPVPWGNLADTKGLAATGDSIFRVHATGIDATATDADTVLEVLNEGDLTIHVRVNDPDFDVSATGEDRIAVLTDTDGDGLVIDEIAGPVKITITRGSSEHIVSTAGGPTQVDGKITVATTIAGIIQTPAPGGIGALVAPFINTPEAGPITEIAPDAGIFELDFGIRYTDGPTSATCPVTASHIGTNGTARGSAAIRFFDVSATPLGTPCILQGDILTIEYTDPTDASGDPNTVTDSATFDLRNGVLQSDKSVYIIGSDMIMTVIEPDWDLDNDGAETYDLDTIEWDSDAAETTMGNNGIDPGKFDPEPSDLRETGDSTGIFQVVIEIPDDLAGDNLERGEEIVLEYTDWGPSGADYVGDEDEDVNLTIFTSNFGATVELDQKVYTWTDKIYITIVAPDHNFDSNLIDEIGDTSTDPVKVATRGSDIDNYKLVETGTDTGIFTGEVILTGFGGHDATGDGVADIATPPPISPDGSGPTDGLLPADDDDGITVSFEFSEDETVVGSSLIRWNIGEVQWLEASYPATGTGVVRVVDPDLNLNPEAVDNFDADVWSDSDAGGIDLTVTETNEATGIFEGTVFFTITDESSGHRLRVAEGDTITAEYEDNTLPDPYTTADELDITGTSIIGTIVPPLERAPASGLRVVDAFGNSLGEVSVDQQVQITSDLANGQDREQAFAYLVQVQDGNGVTVSLAWITGSLTAGQSFSPALSWLPDASGTYTATAFVWESVDNPTALSPPVTTTVNVN